MEKTPLYSQQVDKDVWAELCNDNGSEASPLALMWGTGLLGVVTSLAKRKSDEFDSHVLHHMSKYSNGTESSFRRCMLWVQIPPSVPARVAAASGDSAR